MAIIREYDELTAQKLGLNEKEFNEFKKDAIDNLLDKHGNNLTHPAIS